MTTAATSHASMKNERRTNGPPGQAWTPASRHRHRPLLRLPTTQVLELALHSARNEAECRVHAVERPDVVEGELAELVRGNREWQVHGLSGAGDELDQRHRHRDDDAAPPRVAADLRGDLAVRPG